MCGLVRKQHRMKVNPGLLSSWHMNTIKICTYSHLCMTPLSLTSSYIGMVYVTCWCVYQALQRCVDQCTSSHHPHFNNALCCTLTMPFQYTSPPLTTGTTTQPSANNLIAWIDTVLLVSPVVRSRHQDHSLSTIYT